MSGSYVLGVDIGTMYTAAAVCRGGVVTPCTLGNRSTSVPTVVAVLDNGDVVVGDAAERRAVADPGSVARNFKRRLGDTTPLILGGRPRTPQALMADVLRWVVRQVSELEDRAPSGIALTHPANYGPYKLDLMREVAHLADVSDVRLISEPEAAAVAYARKAVIDPGRVVAVYDFGGGTFDAALVRRIASGGFEVLPGADGLDRLGGVDIDDLFLADVLDRAGVAEPEAARPADLQALRMRCREAKEALATDSAVTISLAGVPAAVGEVTVKRAELVQMVESRVLRTVESLQRAIRNSDLATTDIDRVLLVGGSSRLAGVADTVRVTLRRPVAADIDPKAAVSNGAALAAQSIGTGGPAAGARGDGPPGQGDRDDGSDDGARRSNRPPAQVIVRRRRAVVGGGVVAVAAVVAAIAVLTRGDEAGPATSGTERPAAAAANGPDPTSGLPSSPSEVVAERTEPPTTTPLSTSAPVTSSVASGEITAPSTPPERAAAAPLAEATTPPATTPPNTTPPDTTPPLAAAPTPPVTQAKTFPATDFFQDGFRVALRRAEYTQSTGAVRLLSEITNLSEVEASASSMTIGLISAGRQVTGASEGAAIAPGERGQLVTSVQVPDGFSIDDAVMFTGDVGEHRTLVNLSTGGVQGVGSLPIEVSGSADLGGVTFTATRGAVLAARCSAEDGRLRLGPAPGTEYSIVVYGRVRVTPAAAGTHPSAPALTGPARFLVPSGSSITATFTPDLSLTGASSADEVPVCLGSLAAPLAGRYELQLPTSTSAPASVAFTVPATLDPAPVVPAAPPDQPTVVVPNAQPATGGGSSTGTTKPRATTTSTAFSFGSLSPTKITKSAGTNGLVTMTIRYSNLPKFPDMRASMSGQSGDKNMNAETSPSPASGSTSATFKIAYVCNSTGTATQPLTVRELTTGASKSFQVTLVCT